MTDSPKNEFIELISENTKVDGLDELSSKIIGILFAEAEEVALEELAKRTGYSLSAVSTAMKFIERAGIVKRSKKPGSKKVYFFMEKDMLAMNIRLLRRKYEYIVLPSKNKLPGIIESYKLERSKTSEEELKIVEDYYKQVLYSDQVITDMIKMLERYEVDK